MFFCSAVIFSTLTPGAQLDLVAGDGGAAGAAGDGGVDLELVEHLGDGVGHDGVGGAALLGRVARDEQAQRRQGVGPFDDAVQHLCLGLPGRATAGLAGCRLGDGRSVVVAGKPRGVGRLLRRPGLRLAVERALVVVAVGEVFAGHAVVGEPVFVVPAVPVVVPVVIVVALPEPGAEHGPHGVGHLADRGPGQEQQAEHETDEQQRRRDPGRQPVRQRPTDREADETRRVAPRLRVFRRARPQVAQAEHRQSDQAGAEYQPGPRVGVGLGAHQRHRHRGGDQRKGEDPRADERAKQGVHPRAERAGGVEPRTGGDDDGRGPAAPARSRRGGVRARCRGRGRSTGRRRRSPARPSARWRARPGHRSAPWPPAPTGCAVWRACSPGRAVPLVARDPADSAKRPLTCSFGFLSGRRSY